MPQLRAKMFQALKRAIMARNHLDVAAIGATPYEPFELLVEALAEAHICAIEAEIDFRAGLKKELEDEQ